MATSGTYSWNPDIAEFSDEAWERCGIDPVTLVSKHIRSARMSLNLLFSGWAARGNHNYAVDEQTQTLTDSAPDYTAATGTLAILGGVIRRSGIDTPVRAISLEVYQQIPDKTIEGLPTVVFFDRKALTYYLWSEPENSTDVFRYWRLRRTQDVTAATETADVDYLWFEALASGLAAKLALKFAPTRVGKLEAAAEKAFVEAQLADRERTGTTFSMRGI